MIHMPVPDPTHGEPIEYCSLSEGGGKGGGGGGGVGCLSVYYVCDRQYLMSGHMMLYHCHMTGHMIL